MEKLLLMHYIILHEKCLILELMEPINYWQSTILLTAPSMNVVKTILKKKEIYHSPSFKNLGFFSFPSKTSQYGETNAINIKTKEIIVKQRATRRFLLCAPILMNEINESRTKFVLTNNQCVHECM